MGVVRYLFNLTSTTLDLLCDARRVPVFHGVQVFAASTVGWRRFWFRQGQTLGLRRLRSFLDCGGLGGLLWVVQA